MIEKMLQRKKSFISFLPVGTNRKRLWGLQQKLKTLLGTIKCNKLVRFVIKNIFSLA